MSRQQKDPFAIPSTFDGAYDTYLMLCAGIGDHDSRRQDADYRNARRNGTVRHLPSFVWGGLDVFNAERKTPVTSVLHGVEDMMRRFKVRHWRDVGPIVDALRTVPGFEAVAIPSGILTIFAHEEREAREIDDARAHLDFLASEMVDEEMVAALHVSTWRDETFDFGDNGGDVTSIIPRGDAAHVARLRLCATEEKRERLWPKIDAGPSTDAPRTSSTVCYEAWGM